MEQITSMRDDLIKSLPFKLTAIKPCGCDRKPTEDNIYRGVVFGKLINGNPVYMADEDGQKINVCIQCRWDAQDRNTQAKITEATDRLAWDLSRRNTIGKTPGEVLTGRELAEYRFHR